MKSPLLTTTFAAFVTGPVSALRAALGEWRGVRGWPAPRGGQARGVLAAWFEGKSCARCGRLITTGRGPGHQPAFKAADDRVWEWTEIPAESLRAFLATARAVCGGCMTAGGFRGHRPRLAGEGWRPRPLRHH